VVSLVRSDFVPELSVLEESVERVPIVNLRAEAARLF
jgi:hypothetical protein